MDPAREGKNNLGRAGARSRQATARASERALQPARQGREETDLSLHESERCVCFKRMLLTVPLAGALCAYFLPSGLFFSLYVFSPVCFLSAYAVLCNFPQLGSWIHTKPLHVDDLHVPDSRKQSVLMWYTYITNFLLALVITGIMDWTFSIKQEHRRADTFEILGILGGVLSLYLKTESVVALSLLHLAFRHKKRRGERQRTRLGRESEGEAVAPGQLLLPSHRASEQGGAGGRGALPEEEEK